MKIIKPGFNEVLKDKLNFIDNNNVIVGYDFNQHCCEKFGYILTAQHPNEINEYLEKFEGEEIENLDDYNFDTLFYVHVGDVVYFKLTNSNNDVIYLILYNYHNGYYSHGFEFNNNGEIIEENYL